MKIAVATPLLATVICSVALAGAGRQAEEKTTAKAEETQKPAAAKTQPPKVWTDDDFVEYWAQMTYWSTVLAQKYAMDPVKYAEKWNEILNKLGIAGDEGERMGERWSQWMADWTMKAMGDPEKVGKEWEALSKRMEKRLEELKKEN